MSFWTGFAGGIQAGSVARSRWDERGGLAGLFGGGETGQAAEKPMSDASAAVSGSARADAGDGASADTGPVLPAQSGARASSVDMPADLDAAARAIRTIESGSAAGNYRALGPVTRTGDRAFGAYQVMGANIPSWTERHFGQRLTPQQFLANPAAQDAVFRGQFGGYMSRHGAEGASRAWFAGEGGMNRTARRDVLGTSVGGYNSKFGRLYSSFLNTERPARNVTRPTSGDAGDIEPIRVQPGEVEIPPLFANQVPADAGQQISASPEVEGLVSSVRRGAPGLAVTAPAARALRAGEVDSATDPQLVEEDAPPPAPIRGETAELEARAYARGGVGDGAGGRGAVSAVRPAPGLGVQARAVAPRALGPGEVDSATDPQMAASPEGSGTAAGYAGGAAGGRASASATVPGSTPQEAPAPAARPAPRREAAPRAAAPAAAPAPQARAQPAAERPANNPSERERLMLLRDPESLAPGEEERLRAGLPQNTLGMPDLMSLFRGRQAAAQTREKAAERTQPAARPAPSAGDPVSTGSVPAAPVRDEPSRAPVGPSGNVQEGDQPAAEPSAPAQRAPAPVPHPEPRNDQERFANGRAAAQAALDRGEPPQRIAEGLTAAGVPVEEWPPALRQVRPASRRGPVYDAQGQLMPEHGGLTGAAREQAMRTGRAPGIVMVQPR